MCGALVTTDPLGLGAKRRARSAPSGRAGCGPSAAGGALRCGAAR
jgi:hypothetical protein